MILHIYTIIHTLISLVAIFTGIVVLFGMLAGNRLDCWTGRSDNCHWILFPVSWLYASHRSWDYFAAIPRDHDFRSLFQTSRRRMALDLRDRRGDLSLFQFVRIGGAVI